MMILYFFTTLLLVATIQARQLLNNNNNNNNDIDSNVARGSDSSCSTAPVRKALVNFPDSIIGQISAKSLPVMWSGYVEVAADNQYFYWLFRIS